MPIVKGKSGRLYSISDVYAGLPSKASFGKGMLNMGIDSSVNLKAMDYIAKPVEYKQLKKIVLPWIKNLLRKK